MNILTLCTLTSTPNDVHAHKVIIKESVSVNFPKFIYREYNIYKAVKGVHHLFENWYLLIYFFA